MPTDPTTNFLTNYFMVKNGKQEAQLRAQQAQLAQQKFAWEQSSHAADMKQRADEFQQEMGLRNQQYTAEQAFRNSQATAAQQAREIADQRDFRDKAGVLMPTPTDQAMPFQTGGSQGPAQQSMLPQVPGVTVPPQPVGPSAASMPDAARLSGITQGLPLMKSPVIPMQGTLTAQAQEPDPRMMTKVTPPLGTPAGQSAYMPTLLGKASASKEAENEANQMEITPELASALPEYGFKGGDSVDRRILPLLEKHIDFKAQQAQHAEEFGQSLEEKRRAEQDQNLYRQGMLALQAEKAGKGSTSGEMYGESALDNPDAKIPTKFQPDALKYLGDKYGMKSLPADMPAGDVRPFEGAVNTMKMIEGLKQQLKDPLIASNLGPIMGRVQDLTQRLGNDPRYKNNPGAIAAMQDFRTQVTGNLANELQTINPRAASSLLALVREMAPSEKMTPAMFEGALNGMSTIAYNRIKAARDRQFGGHAPDQVMDKYQKPQAPITSENPGWRKQGDPNYIGPDDSKVVNAGGTRVYVYHDGASDKYYQLATMPK